MLVGLAMGVSAAGNKLLFNDVDVKVGSKTSKNLDDGDTINDEAAPGDEVEFKVEMRNNFTNAEDLRIENIAITITIEGIDDGDDLDEDLKEFDLNTNSDKRATSNSFVIPLEVGEGDYDVTIDAEGEDENGTTHTATMNLVLQVEKEKHELQITKAVLSPEQVKCSKNVQFGVTVLNTGQEDEDESTLTVTNSQLGVDFKDTFDVTEGEFDSDMEFSKTYSFTVPKNTEAGTYPIAIKAVYDDARKSVSKNVDLVVQECTVEETPATSGSIGQTPAAQPTGGSTTVVVTQPTGSQQTTADIIQPTTTTQPGQSTAQAESQESGSLFESKTFLIGVIMVEVLVVVLGIAFVAYLMRRS